MLEETVEVELVTIEVSYKRVKWEMNAVIPERTGEEEIQPVKCDKSAPIIDWTLQLDPGGLSRLLQLRLNINNFKTTISKHVVKHIK